MQEETLRFIRKHHMICRKDRVIAALSGGADSVCLLYLLALMKEELQIQLEAVHVHHGIRGAEADRDGDFAQTFCEKLGIPFILVRRDVPAFAGERGLSLEAAGRLIRYEVFEAEAKRWGANKIAVAHHGGDNAETILHHLVRGSGLKGLGGIEPVRGMIIRPLLWAQRDQIVAYLREQHQSYCDDSTNEEDDYTRNRLRHQVVPLLKREINQNAEGNILQAGEICHQADRYLRKQAERVLLTYGKAEKDFIGIDAKAFLSQEEIIRQYIGMLMAESIQGPGKDLSFVHVNQICLLAGKPSGRRINLPCGLEAWREGDRLCVGNAWAGNLKTKELFPGNPVMTVFSYKKEAEIPKNPYTKWFDYDKIKGTLSVRGREIGDYFTLASGGRKTVKSYMIDEKIPERMRDRILLLADGNHILWIVGYRISEYYKVTCHTAQVLQVQFDGGKNNGT